MNTQFCAARRWMTAAIAALAVTTSACDQLLDVDNPSNVPDGALADPSLMPALEASAIQTAQCGILQYAVTGGMLSGEYISANGFVNNHIWEWRGIVEIKGAPGSCNYGRTSTDAGFYLPLQTARFQLDDAFSRVDAFTDEQVPNRARILTEMRAYAGYSYMLLAEGMCEMTLDEGPSMTKAEVIAIAIDRFTDAITRATALGGTDGQSLLNMALVGRARAYLDIKDLTHAAADAAQVPAGFVRNATFSESTPTRENRWYDLTVRNNYISVGFNYLGLTTSVGGNTVPDPRVPVQDMNTKPDNITEFWRQLKYTGSGAAPMPIASYAEAQLIWAEATGRGQPAIDALNRVRALKGIDAITAVPATDEDFLTLVLEERRRQLFSEGQRYTDMLRYHLPFEMGVNGVNRKGQTFSTLTCVPLPDLETQNNPNFKGKTAAMTQAGV